MFQTTISRRLLHGNNLQRVIQPLYSSSATTRNPLLNHSCFYFSTYAERDEGLDKNQRVAEPNQSLVRNQKEVKNVEQLGPNTIAAEKEKAKQEDALKNSTLATISPEEFDDPKSAHGSKTLSELLRASLVFRLCNIRSLVKHSESLFALSYRIFGSTITNAIVRQTMFGHFCGGESAEDIRPTIDKLRANGIGSILDYAAESDISDLPKVEDETPLDEVMTKPPDQNIRVYDYESEEMCDMHMRIFKSCIHAVQDVTPDGFAAVKITALGNPLLLARMTTAITEAKNLFAKFDHDRDGRLSRDVFKEGYHLFFNDADEKLPELLDRLDPNGTNKIDYIEWSKLLTPNDLPRIVANCREHGPLFLASPSAEEIDLMKAMHERAHNLAEEAFKCNVRLLIDSEQNCYQAAIDNLTLELQEKYNATNRTDVPTIFNTYQCYLKDMPERMIVDVERSRRHSYHFAAKLVRGAYMTKERALALEMGYPSPIHDTFDDTHACYDQAMEYLLRYRVENNVNLEVMCATHNRASILNTVELMKELGIGPQDPAVHFAQLYGMADNLSYTLGRHGFRAYKYLPYGKVNEVIPYLIRRAQENGDMLGNSSVETGMANRELKRRLFRKS